MDRSFSSRWCALAAMFGDESERQRGPYGPAPESSANHSRYTISHIFRGHTFQIQIPSQLGLAGNGAPMLFTSTSVNRV